MTEKEIQLFNDSLERCTDDSRFLERFYDRFLSSSEEVAEKFKNTDFRKQRRTLKASLYMLIFAAEGKPEGLVHLERIAKLHKELEIKPEFYDIWLDCLIQTVREFDRFFTPETEKAWRSVLVQGIDIIKSRY